MKSRLLLAMLFSQLVACVVVSAADRVVSIPGHKLKVSVPAGYSFETKRDEEGVLVAMGNPVWEIEIIARVATESDPACTTTQWQQDHLVTLMSDWLSQSKEQDYKFKPLNPKTGTGTYCVFTDPDLKPGQPHKPGDYVYMVGGIRARNGCIVAFRIMTNDLTSAEYREAFALLTDGFSE